MAYIDRDILEDYPHYAYFYHIEVDESLPLDQQTEQKVIHFETPCDITESSHSWSRNFIWAKYAVYFPFDTETGSVQVKMGDMFEANLYGMNVNGKVVGAFPSQLGGVTVYVQDTDV